jgi:hypothetical protein
VRDAVRSAQSQSRLRLDDAVSWGAAACSIIPGLGHIIVGRRTIGFGLMIAWVLLILLYLVNYGSAGGFFCGTLAVGIHCAAICMLLSRTLQQESVGFRAVFGLGVYVLLAILIYGPMYWGTNQFIGAVPAYGIRPVPGVQEGDLLIHTGPWLRPTLQRGDLVAYRIHAHRVGPTTLGDGVLFDRILGLPGDTIDIKGREVAVNGIPQPQELAPLSGTPASLHLTAGPDEYIIVPSLLHLSGHGDYRDSMQAVIDMASHVPKGDILGRIIWRVGPGLDFGPIKGSLQ